MLNELAAEAYENSRDHGWWDDEPNIPEKLALIHSEISEVLEDFRHGRSMTEIIWEVGPKSGLPKPAGIPVELADILIRVFDLAGKYQVDLDSAVREKMAYNKDRPYRHGNLLA